MSGVSVLMLVLLVHVAGVELDSAREAVIDRFAAGTPAGRWELTEGDDGHYQFAGAGELVRIERLEHPDLTYAVVYGRDATDLLGVGAVSLLAYGDALRLGRPHDALNVPASEGLVAWRLSPVETGDEAISDLSNGDEGVQIGVETPEVAEDHGSPEVPASDLTGSLIVTATRGQMSISHPESGHVMVLRYSP
ncbi:MAG: hypothetical protein MI724_13445 [Spirochaetales bacterium]|nr:hypothetical protein [Spirochaetales bacterium]